MAGIGTSRGKRERKSSMIDPKYFENCLGLPCVGCGYCCMKAQCGLSFVKYGYQKVCPALQWDGRRHVCVWAKEHARDLAIGGGCCSSLFNSWRDDIRDRRGEAATRQEI
jgi:hypothetical protein